MMALCRVSHPTQLPLSCGTFSSWLSLRGSAYCLSFSHHLCIPASRKATTISLGDAISGSHLSPAFSF